MAVHSLDKIRLTLSNKGKWRYVPWIGLLCTTIMVVGTILWGVKLGAGVDCTKEALDVLDVDVVGSAKGAKLAFAIIVVFYAVFTIILLVQSSIRSCIEAKVDRTGTVGAGSTSWMVIHSILIACWYLITIALALLLLACGLWYATMYATHVVVDSTVKTAQRATEKLNQLNSPGLGDGSSSYNSSAPLPTWGEEDEDAGLTGVSNSTGTCPAGCLDLSMLNFIIQEEGYTLNQTCFCYMDKLQIVSNKSQCAKEAIGHAAIGGIIMFLGALLVLMYSVGDFAQARKERDLILRANKGLAKASALAMGAVPVAGEDDQEIQLGVVVAGDSAQQQQAQQAMEGAPLLKTQVSPPLPQQAQYGQQYNPQYSQPQGQVPQEGQNGYGPLSGQQGPHEQYDSQQQQQHPSAPQVQGYQAAGGQEGGYQYDDGEGYAYDGKAQ